MYKRILPIFISLLILTSCARSSSVNQPANKKDNTEISVVDKISSENQEIKPASLGNVTIKKDSGRSVSSIMPENKELVLEVTDASGAQWTLTIPAYAIPARTEISMTPLSEIKNGSYPCAITSGVMLEPDGLKFDKPGKLTVKLSSNSSPHIMLTGDSEGNGLNFMNAEQAKGSVTAAIEHFSTAYFQPENDPHMRDLQNKTTEDYKSVLQLVKELLKRPIEVLHPPDISLECLTDEKYAQASEFADKTLQPEMLYFDELTKLGKEMCLLGSEQAEKESLEYAGRIFARLALKADQLITLTKDMNPDTFLATAKAVLRCYQLAFAFNYKVPDPDEAMGAYAKKTADYCLAELRDKHNFKYTRAAFEIGRFSALLGNENTVDEVIRALTFKLEYKLNFDQTMGDWRSTWVINGKAEIKYAPSKNSYFAGSGQGEYEPIVSTYQGMSAGSFPFNVKITKFDPCETNSIIFNFDALSAQSETYWFTQKPSDKTDDPYVKKFLDYLMPPENGQYALTLPFKNEQEEVCNDTVRKEENAEAGRFTVDINIKLTHTPKM
jgi:hypothetical protein